ncbi:MAG: GtrA family protein [Bacilli bacterium]
MINKIRHTFFTPEFIKFVIVGTINTINHNIIYLASLTCLNYLIANFIAFIISMIISFFLNCYITFKVKPTIKKLVIFPLTNLPNLFFQTFGIYIVVELIKIPKEYGALVTALLAVPFTFMMMKLILERDNFFWLKKYRNKTFNK